MTEKFDEIGNSIQKIASLVAKELDRATNTGLGIQEESLTDMILNRIQSEQNDNFLTKKFSHKDEGNITGADWLWCIGEPGAWITFAVQAKITNLKTGRVNHLHYKNGDQFSKLIHFSKRFRFIPKFTIYSKMNTPLQLFSTGVPILKNLSLEDWSFSSISPKYVKHLVKPFERHMSSVLQFAIPWSYIFNFDNLENMNLATKIAANLEMLYSSFDIEYTRRQKEKDEYNYERIETDNPQPSKMVTDSIPIPVLFLMTQKISPSFAPVSNVCVLSNISVNQALCVEFEKISNSRKWKNFPGVFEREIRRIRNNY